MPVQHFSHRAKRIRRFGRTPIHPVWRFTRSAGFSITPDRFYGGVGWTLTTKRRWRYGPSRSDYGSGNAVNSIPYSQIKINGMALGSDGIRWTTYPDGKDVPLSIQTGVLLSKIDPGESKYHPYITANGANLDTSTPEFCVGQNVTFTLNGLPLGNIVNMAGQWNLPGKFVNQPTNYSSTCTTYVENDTM
jgi:hypothetical protein